MLADFYIPRLLNDIKIAVQRSHLGGKILYRSPNLKSASYVCVTTVQLFKTLSNKSSHKPP